MTRLIRAGQVQWQLAFGFDFPSGTIIIIPEEPLGDQTGDISYYRRYLLDVAPSLGSGTVTLETVEVISEDVDYYRRYLCDT